ncbi:Crp/Fnr family transcriptional regulator [Bosea caraganae]|uniref:Crp/Fnr family transcriptional regulator n=1 Tax=Bosea caraganae TaxID=2763117 RepID=A0A370KYR8_9HYPH|nr:Crp/Fnr family transcriptional regulator [Bosea caraganae]RDJ20131.1 Crp/Fnr family transcriptional regulator [Bosea caraganae]RDJ24843.1 Crp/Fnr family transcriptional regulator [Bosea caraganae]
MNDLRDDRAIAVEALIRYLECRDQVSAYERNLLANLSMRFKAFGKGEELVVEHSRPNESCLVLSGFTGREVMLKDGTRQITAVHIPGDFVDLHALLLKLMDHSVVALTEVHAAYVPHQELVRISEAAPHLSRLLWLSTVVDGAIQRAWIACIGRRKPLHHLGHLICELSVRLNAVGLAPRHSFDFPVTQAQLADVLGMSLVQVNRTLQALRRTGLVSWKASTVTIHDFAALAELCDFDPIYLNLINEPR